MEKAGFCTKITGKAGARTEKLGFRTRKALVRAKDGFPTRKAFFVEKNVAFVQERRVFVPEKRVFVRERRFCTRKAGRGAEGFDLRAVAPRLRVGSHECDRKAWREDATRVEASTGR